MAIVPNTCLFVAIFLPYSRGADLDSHREQIFAKVAQGTLFN